MLTIAEARLNTARRLHGSPSPTLDADLLLGHLLDCDRTALFARSRDLLSDADEFRLMEITQVRASGTPVAYITGKRWWYGLEFEVTPGVLIPRPETEILVALALDRARECRLQWILDVGTGSGAIAIALARSDPKLKAYATDVSLVALEVAGRNGRRHGVSRQITWQQSDLLANVESEPDLVVANLPYVAESALCDLSPEVQAEPHGALIGGPEGTEIIERLIREVASRGWRSDVMLECDPRQVAALLECAARHLPHRRVNVTQDLCGRDRVVSLCADVP